MAGRKLHTVINHVCLYRNTTREWNLKQGLSWNPRKGKSSQRGQKVHLTARKPKKVYKIWHHYGQRFTRHFLKWLCVFTWYTKVLLLCTISLHFNFFSLYTRRIKIKKSVKNMHEHASRLTGKMKMRSRDCTEHRHTKIIHFSPWCEVSIVPPPPPRTICHPFPSYEVSS